MTITTVAVETANASMNNRREYQWSLSKQRMNENRYSVSGKTHRKGTAATSRQTWFVVANNITDAAIANPNHMIRVPIFGSESPQESLY
jgi:predicted deacetylase